MTCLFSSKLHGQLEMHRYSKGRWQSSIWVIWSAWCSEWRPGLCCCTECSKRGHWKIDYILQDHPEEIWSRTLIWYGTSHWDQLIVLDGHATRLALNMGPLFWTAFKEWSLSLLFFLSVLLCFTLKADWMAFKIML